MDEQYMKSVILGLKSTSSTKVQETLIKLRSQITGNDKGIQLFRTCGGLECLLPHLRKPNERILDVSLSILGNCCLEEECSLAVGKLNICNPIISIIKTVCRDSIVGRACRLLGNLAQRNVNAELLHSHNAVSTLIDLIEKRDRNTSYPTLTMAVRAIRQLWMVTEKRDEMLSINTVRCVAILMTTECEAAGIIKPTNQNLESDGLRKSQEELMLGILKCLGYFTTHASVQCAEQIQGDGRGYQCLVALTKAYETLALKCLMNLCYISSCRPLLGTAGFVECLVGILKKSSGPGAWPEGGARALSQLSGEAVNRSRLRRAHGLPLLLAAAASSAPALRALLQYVFDDTSFQILINEGLVELLTEELLNHLQTMEVEHTVIDTEDGETPRPETSEPVISGADVKPQDDSAQSLFERRRKTHSPSKSEDELKVVIERDNMIVGFVDAVDSDASDDSDRSAASPGRRRRLKRTRSVCGEDHMKKNSNQIKMLKKDWSAGVYWEPKSPEWPASYATSPDRAGCSPQSQPSDGNQSGLSPEPGGSKRPRWDWSPESGISSGEGSSASPYWTEYQWSPSSSGSPQSYSVDDGSSDSDVSGRYSPVCSDGSAAEAGADMVTHHLDDLAMDDDDDAPLEEDSGLPAADAAPRVLCALVLLYRAAHAADAPPALPAALPAVLRYVRRCRRPLGRAARILSRALGNTFCLMSVLKQRLVLKLHKMCVDLLHPPDKCVQCKQIARLGTKLTTQLGILAESGYGLGEVSYQLLKGPPAVRRTLAFTLPYVVRTMKPLKKYFIDCDALSTLLDVTAGGEEDLRDCVVALSKLAASAHVKDPKSLEHRYRERRPAPTAPAAPAPAAAGPAAELVTFRLDDGSTVLADKLFLCQHSDVFSAMLLGCFKESAEERVSLRSVSRPALEYLLTLLRCGLNEPRAEVAAFPTAALDTSLEALLLADRFLLEPLKASLNSAILQFLLGPRSADRVYAWALTDGVGHLCVEAVAYILTGDMSEAQRTALFSNILHTEYREQWLDDIKAMICRQLVK